MARGVSMRGVCVAVLGVGLFFGRSAEAAPPIDVTYDAPEGCPPRAELETELGARIPAGWIHESDRRRFEVHIERDPTGFAGRLLLHAPGRAPKIREIHAPECREVSTAIAVFIAIALDPASGEEPPPAPPEPSRNAAPIVVRPAPAKAPPRPVWSWSSGLELVHLRMPNAAWGGRVYGEIARAAPPRPVEPALRMSWGWSDFSVPVARAGSTNFRLLTARLEGCARVLLSRFSIAPCAAFDVGTLEGTTPDLPRVGHATTRWTSADLLVRAGRPIGPWVSIDIHAGLLVPFERTAFVVVNPDRNAYRPPAAVFEAGLGACVTSRFR